VLFRSVAAALVDRLSDGYSLIYSFYDPDEERRSLGSFMILDHIAQARAANQAYVYLGYWVQGSAKMDYKARYQPLEVLRRGGWRRLPLDQVTPDTAQTNTAQTGPDTSSSDLGSLEFPALFNTDGEP